MRKIVALLSVFLFSSICWGQYSTQYTWGVSDLSGRMSNTNLWYPLKNKTSPYTQGLCAGAPTIGFDLQPVCLSNGTTTPSSNDTVWYFNTQTITWTQITGVGTGWYALASINVNNLYLLKPTTDCTPLSRYGIFHWNGSTLTRVPGCALQINAGEDGGVVASNLSQSPTQFYYMPPGGTSFGYVAADQSQGWTYAHIYNQNDMCGVKNGLIYWYDSDDSDGVPGSFTQMPSQPPASNLVYTCHIANDPNSGLVMFAKYRSTNNHGQYITLFAFYDFNTGVWTPIQLPSAGISAVASVGKWPTVVLDNSGLIWHFNVYGVYHAATLTGSVNQCPPPNPCNPSNVTHNGVVRATLQGGLYGTQATGNYAPSANMNVTSYDVTATGCDSLFSDPTQCIPVDTGSVQCSQSGFLFPGTPSNGNPPEPQSHWAEYAGGYDLFFSTINIVPESFDGHPGFLATSIAGYTDNACYPGTYSLCQPPYGGDSVTITTGCINCTPDVAAAKGRWEASQHKKAGGTVWGAFFNYTPGLTASCDRITVYSTKVNTPCF